MINEAGQRGWQVLFPTLAGLMWHGTIQSPVGSYLVVLSWDSTISFQRVGVAVWTLLGLHIHTFLWEHRSQRARWPLPMLPLSDSLCKTSIELSLFFFKWVAVPFSQEIFPTRGSNPDLLHWRRILYLLNHQGSPRILEWVACPFSSGSSRPRNRTGVSCIAGEFFTSCSTREALGCFFFFHFLIPPCLCFFPLIFLFFFFFLKF